MTLYPLTRIALGVAVGVVLAFAACGGDGDGGDSGAVATQPAAVSPTAVPDLATPTAGEAAATPTPLPPVSAADSVPGSCRILAERFCATAQLIPIGRVTAEYDESANLQRYAGPEDDTVTTAVAFRVEAGAILFAPADGEFFVGSTFWRDPRDPGTVVWTLAEGGDYEVEGARELFIDATALVLWRLPCGATGGRFSCESGIENASAQYGIAVHASQLLTADAQPVPAGEPLLRLSGDPLEGIGLGGDYHVLVTVVTEGQLAALIAGEPYADDPAGVRALLGLD